MVTWMEPKERGFTIEVPRGWQVTGGVNWTGPIDAQGFVWARSPDGAVQLFVGDPDILPRQVPDQWSRMQTGVTEGQVFRSPSGGQAILEPFRTGAEYAKRHIAWRLCRNPRIVREGDLPDMARSVHAALEPEFQAYGVRATTSVGWAGFLCDDDQGYVIAITVMGHNQIPVWAVIGVAGFVSSDALRSMQARYLAERMLGTYRLDPRWNQAYQERVRQVTGQVISMQNALLQVSLNASRQAANSLSRLNNPNPGVSSRSGSRSSGVNTILGTRDVCDAIGRCKNVSNDAETLFMDHSGNVRSGRAGGVPPDNTGVWSPL